MVKTKVDSMNFTEFESEKEGRDGVAKGGREEEGINKSTPTHTCTHTHLHIPSHIYVSLAVYTYVSLFSRPHMAI